MTNKESMVIYESAYKAINYLPDVAMKWEAIEGLMKYGFYGEEPESDNPFINMVYVQAIPSMRSAKERYEKAVENGKKGGRPTDIKDEDIIKYKSEGKTNKEIADIFGVTEKAIEKRVTNIRKNNPTNPTNLSVSVSVSDSVSESSSVSDTVVGEEREIAYAKEEREEEREIEDLSIEEKKELYKLYQKNDRVNYGYYKLKNMFNLKGKLDKDFFKKLKDDIEKIEYQEAQEKAHEFAMARFDESYYEYKGAEYQKKTKDLKNPELFKDLW